MMSKKQKKQESVRAKEIVDLILDDLDEMTTTNEKINQKCRIENSYEQRSLWNEESKGHTFPYKKRQSFRIDG